jgi:predicted enzyme related to lactoylglutathione lyase
MPPSGAGPFNTMTLHTAHFILYVRDQARSTAFYSAVLESEPSLDVPGMTEFALPGGAVLGLMPEAGNERLLGPALPSPTSARGVPRAEVYLVVDDVDAYHGRALANGARELSAPLDRDWGQCVAYSADPDGHVLAFARALAPGPDL